MRRDYASSVAAFSCCVLLVANCFAKGKIIIQPMIETGLQYNSNFWQSEAEEAGVNTYYLKPGIVFGYETPKTRFNFAATVNGYWYEDLDPLQPGNRAASDDDYIGFTGELIADHQLTDRLNVGVSDELYITRDPARADGNNNSTNRDKYLINYFQTKLYYEFADKVGTRAAYRNTVTEYEDDLESSNENRGTIDFYYNLNRSSAVYIDYQVWDRMYDQNSTDYLSNMVSLNYEKELNYFTIKGGAGYHNRTFDAEDIDNFDLFSWKIQIRGQDPDSTLKTTRSRLKLDFGQEMNDDGTGDNYFTATFVHFEGGYRFFEKLEAFVKFNFQNSLYETDDRNEDTYLVSGKLAYQVLGFMTIGLEGGVESRDSNVVGNSFDDSFVIVSLDIDYDFASR